MNLVFNRWDDNGNPLPNLSELSYKVENPVWFPFFINDPAFNIKKCKLEDINNDETFYFIIAMNYSYKFFIQHSEIFIPKEVQYYIKNFDLKIVFLSEHESHMYVESFVLLLIRQIQKNNWKEENFYIIDNNSMLHKLKHKFNTNINFFKANYLIQFYSKNPTPPNIDDIKFDKKFIFLCQNRQPHYHRIIFLTHLKNLNLFENDITNWSLTMRHSEYMSLTQNSRDILSLTHFRKYFDITDKNLINHYKSICNTKKLCFYKEDISWEDGVTFNFTDPTDTFKSELNFQNSYINIVTESHYHFMETDVHITEKSFKPFYFFQLPIFLASYNHVKTMREEYDLDFFDDLINHNYDNEKDDVKRIDMVVKEIQRLSNMREEIHMFYKNNINRLINNHNFLKKNNYGQIFKDYILNI